MGGPAAFHQGDDRLVARTMTRQTDSTNAAMRIALMLESDGHGGAEVMVFQLAEELRRRGHSVVHVGPKHGVGWLGGKFRDAGIPSLPFQLRRPIDPSAVRYLADLFREHSIDVVHSHEFTMAVYGTAAARRAGVRHVITMHGNQKMCDALRRRIAVRWAIRHSRASVAISAATQTQLLRDLGLASNRLGIVRNGVPIRPGHGDAVRRELGAAEQDVLILAVGNLDPRKGHIFLLRALHELTQQGLSVPWRLAIAGGRGGPERTNLEAFADAHGYADRVHILLQREDIPDLQAAADIFAMPSLWEGLPLALLEAMLAGSAIVASKTSGIPEAVTSEEHGILTPPGDVHALAGALRRVLEDSSLRRTLGDAAKARANAEFTVSTMTAAYERLYRDG